MAHIGPALPAMGYGTRQVDELRATIAATPCDVVVTGTPIDLRRVLDVDVPIRHATYELHELGHPTLADVLGPVIEHALPERTRTGSPGRARRATADGAPTRAP